MDVRLNGRKEKLAKGREKKKAAERRLLELRFEASRNPDPDSPNQTVASVIETYQEFAQRRLAGSTLSVRKLYLESFAEAYGWRRISECKPYHMEAWLDERPESVSDWTKNSAIRNVRVTFHWAAKSRIIPENPFRGVTHQAGKPRRDITPDEFRAILRATRHTYHKRRRTPGARFGGVLIFPWYTGCPPWEAAKLRWENVDFENETTVLPEHKTSRTQRKPKPRIIPMHAVRRQKLAQARHCRREKNLQLRQPTLPFTSEETVA